MSLGAISILAGNLYPYRTLSVSRVRVNQFLLQLLISATLYCSLSVIKKVIIYKHGWKLYVLAVLLTVSNMRWIQKWVKSMLKWDDSVDVMQERYLNSKRKSQVTTTNVPVFHFPQSLRRVELSNQNCHLRDQQLLKVFNLLRDNGKQQGKFCSRFKMFHVLIPLYNRLELKLQIFVFRLKSFSDDKICLHLNINNYIKVTVVTMVMIYQRL